MMKSNNQVDIKFLTPSQKKNPEPKQNTETHQKEVESDILNTFYTGDPEISKYYLLCINSWLNLKYKVNIHTNIKISNLPNNVNIVNVETINDLQPAQQADLFRYEYLLNNPDNLKLLAKEKGFKKIIIIEKIGDHIQSKTVHVN